jgi:hypothetical protein
LGRRRGPSLYLFRIRRYLPNGFYDGRLRFWTYYGAPGLGSDSGPYAQVQGTRSYGNEGLDVSHFSCQGTLTATFQWVPDPTDPNDLPPSSVITVEKTTASLGLQEFTPKGPYTANYTVDDGIDSPQTGSGVTASVSLSGSRVKVQSGGTITLTCNPKVIVSYASGGGDVASVSVSYSVDLVYPRLDLSNCVTDPTNGKGLAVPIGQGVLSFVSTNSVFNSVNGAPTNALWSVSDACAGFKVTSSTGTFLPFIAQEPTYPTIDEWYFYQGAPQDGTPKAEPISVSATFSALGTTTTATLTEQINLYGPVVTPKVTGYTGGPISATVSGADVTENSGGISLKTATEDGVDWAASSPYFQFDFNSVQLCDLDEENAGVPVVTTNGNVCLDNSYPYGIEPYSDQPTYAHSAGVPVITVDDSFQWSGVCAPHGSNDFIWVTGAKMGWTWDQTNSPGWGNPVGALLPASVSDGWITPYQWIYVFTNVGGR